MGASSLTCRGTAVPNVNLAGERLEAGKPEVSAPEGRRAALAFGGALGRPRRDSLARRIGRGGRRALRHSFGSGSGSGTGDSLDGGGRIGRRRNGHDSPSSHGAGRV